MKKTKNQSSKKEYIVLVFDGDKTNDWVGLFNETLKTSKNKMVIKIFQTSWMDCEVTLYGEKTCVRINSLNAKSDRFGRVTIEPDLLIIRNQPRGPYPVNDRRNAFYGLMMAGIPSINSLESIYANFERPIVYGGLKKILKKHGYKKFPLIEINYYSTHKEMIISPETPCICKISHAHAGIGKIKCLDTNQFRDVGSIVALSDFYSCAEKFLETKHQIRVQKIGNKYRVYKKLMTGSSWTSHFGGSKLINEKVSDKYKFWADECSKLFGGMDLLAIDAIHTKDGEDVIIELNGSAIGLLPQYWIEDSKIIVNLAIKKIKSFYIEKKD